MYQKEPKRLIELRVKLRLLLNLRKKLLKKVIREKLVQMSNKIKYH